MSKRIACVSLLAVAMAACLADLTSAQETLRWKFEQGQAFDLLVSQEMESSSEQAAFQFTTTMNTELHIDWRVGSVDEEGTAQVTQTIKRAVMDLSMGAGESIHIDTDSPDDAEGLAATFLGEIQSLIDQEIQMTVSSRGEILDLKLSDEAQERLDEGGQELFDEEFMRQAIGNGMLGFPAEAVSAGDTWNHEVNMPDVNTPITLAIEYTYAGQEQHEGREVAVINLSQSMSIEAPEEESEMQLELSEDSGEGYAWFDSQAGYLVQSEIHQSFVMEIEVAGETMTSAVKTKALLQFTPASGE